MFEDLFKERKMKKEENFKIHQLNENGNKFILNLKEKVKSFDVKKLCEHIENRPDNAVGDTIFILQDDTGYELKIKEINGKEMILDIREIR